MDLASDLVKTAMNCQGENSITCSDQPVLLSLLLLAFTSQQISKFTELLESFSPAPHPASALASGSQSSSRSGHSQPRTPDNQGSCGRISTASNREASYRHPNAGDESDTGVLADLAREFGVEAHLVQALAQRLAGLC
jgi:hypothetical protein